MLLDYIPEPARSSQWEEDFRILLSFPLCWAKQFYKSNSYARLSKSKVKPSIALFFFNGDFVFTVPLPASARCKLSDYWESCTWVAVQSLLTLIFSKKCYLMYLVLWLTSKMKVAEWASVTLRPTSSYSHATHHY